MPLFIFYKTSISLTRLFIIKGLIILNVYDTLDLI